MLADSKNAELYPEWAAFIEDKPTRDAFYQLIGIAAASDRYRCLPEKKGAVRDFRYYVGDSEQPFAFIVNRESLLFYFRKPAVESGEYSPEALSADFESFKEIRTGARNEWTVRVQNMRDVEKLTRHIHW